MLHNLSSAAVEIGALRVTAQLWYNLDREQMFTGSRVDKHDQISVKTASTYPD